MARQSVEPIVCEKSMMRFSNGYGSEWAQRRKPELHNRTATK